MKSLLLIFSLIIISYSKAFGSQTYTPMPDLNQKQPEEVVTSVESEKIKQPDDDSTEYDSEIPFLYDGEHPTNFLINHSLDSSCLSDYQFDHHLSSQIRQKFFGKHYFFFSLEKFFEEKHSEKLFKFYKNKDFSLQPEYILNSDGLFKNKVKLCSWRQGYSEKALAKNFLEGCDKNLSQMIGYGISGSAQSHHDLCIVLNVADYQVSSKGEYLYRVPIGDDLFYLDVTHMRDLKNGSKFLSDEYRTLEVKKSKAIDLSVISFRLGQLVESDSFKDFVKCYSKKDKNCIFDVRDDSFSSSIADEGVPAICPHGSSHINQGDNRTCVDLEMEKINKISVDYFRDFIKSVLAFDLNKFEISSDETTPSKSSTDWELMFLPEKTHTGVFKAKILFQFKKGKLTIVYFESGHTC